MAKMHDAADGFQCTYLVPLRIFDNVIGEITNVHPYAKMAQGVLSWAAKIILVAQEDRDPALLKLFEKLSTCFNTQDEMLDHISLMQAAMPGKIS